MHSYAYIGGLSDLYVNLEMTELFGTRHGHLGLYDSLLDAIRADSLNALVEDQVMRRVEDLMFAAERIALAKTHGIREYMGESPSFWPNIVCFCLFVCSGAVHMPILSTSV